MQQKFLVDISLQRGYHCNNLISIILQYCNEPIFPQEGVCCCERLTLQHFLPCLSVLYQFGRDQSQPIFPLDYTNEDYGGQKAIFLNEVWEERQKDDSHKQLQKSLDAPYVLGVVEERSDL